MHNITLPNGDVEISCSISDVDFSHLLDSRESRPADYKSESESLGRLADVLASRPENLANELVEAALHLTGAHSAGLSLEEDLEGKKIFRWVATAGNFAKYLNGIMPRDFSPCGDVVERNGPMLMREPIKKFDYISMLDQPVQEVLLVPFYRLGKAIGTVWVVSHAEGKTFDGEDLRLVRSVTKFAAAAIQNFKLVTGLRAANEAQQVELAISHKDLEQLQGWFDQAPGFVALLRGPTHVFELANKAYEDLVGQQNLLGKSVFEALPELRGQGFEELLDGVYNSGKAYVGRQVKIAVKGNFIADTEKYVDFVYQPVMDVGNRISGIFVQGYDSTERKLVSDALVAADKRKDDFLASLSHEMRSPLAAIKLAAHILKQSNQSADPRQLKTVASIGRQVDQLIGLVNDITDIASIKEGHVQLRIERLVVQEIVARALEACSQQAVEKQHTIEVVMPDEAIFVEGDSLRLTQVMTNLINNAIKYTPSNGEITVSAEGGNNLVHLSVSDSGIGISEHLLPKIFDMFMQVPMKDRPDYSGLGIGLSLVKKFVELHRGSIIVISDGVNRGSTFRVQLPCKSTHLLAK